MGAPIPWNPFNNTVTSVRFKSYPSNWQWYHRWPLHWSPVWKLESCLRTWDCQKLKSEVWLVSSRVCLYYCCLLFGRSCEFWIWWCLPCQFLVGCTWCFGLSAVVCSFSTAMSFGGWVQGRVAASHPMAFAHLFGNHEGLNRNKNGLVRIRGAATNKLHESRKIHCPLSKSQPSLFDLKQTFHGSAKQQQCRRGCCRTHTCG